MSPEPEGGAVGGTFVVTGVSEAKGGGVGESSGSVGVDWAACVCSAWTVIATEVAMTDWFEAAPHALRMKARMEITTIQLY